MLSDRARLSVWGCATNQGLEIEAAEKWIVDLIRGSKLDAKIDSRDNSVIMGGTFPSVYQQVRFGHSCCNVMYCTAVQAFDL